MQQNVQAAFGVKMSELWWQDKVDPDRIENEADVLGHLQERTRGQQ
jgi:hypothetical protein